MQQTTFKRFIDGDNNGVHAYIVKQLTDLENAHSLRSHVVPKQSKSKHSRRSTKVIKIGDKKSPSIPPRFDHNQGRTRKISHIVENIYQIL
jgi:hypothetical protein